MPTIDPRMDAYIAKSAEFARPILVKLREAVHAGCPQVVETMKWSMPAFEHHGLLCQMAAFKAHCTFGFWKGKLVVGEAASDEKAMGQLGRIESVKDLPGKRVLVGYVKKAAGLNEAGVKAPWVEERKKKKKAAVRVPADLAERLKEKKHRKAAACFEELAPSCRKEYVEWIEGAKRAETRAKRLETTLEWLGEGKKRNWKYESC